MKVTSNQREVGHSQHDRPDFARYATLRCTVHATTASPVSGDEAKFGSGKVSSLRAKSPLQAWLARKRRNRLIQWPTLDRSQKDQQHLYEKCAGKYGLDVEIVQINEKYTAGTVNGVSMTNMDTLSIPAGGGINKTALTGGDCPNGNDTVILKGPSNRF